MAFTTADTMSGMSAAVRGRVFNLFSREAPGLSGFPLFFPAVAGVLVAGDLVFAEGLLGGDFFSCVVVSVDFFADDCDFFPLGFGGILITLYQLSNSDNTFTSCLTVDARATAHALVSL